MTLAWAIIIVAILWILFRSGRLKQGLIVAGIIGGVTVVGCVLLLLGVWGYDRYETNQKNKQREQATAQYVQRHDCLKTITGKLRAVNQQQRIALPEGGYVQSQAQPQAVDWFEANAPYNAYNAWCGANEVAHTKGEPIDPWTVVGELPTIPAGNYVVKNGRRDAEGNGGAAAVYGWYRGIQCPMTNTVTTMAII